MEAQNYKFLEKTLKPYFYQLVEENKRYEEEIARLHQENEQLKSTNAKNCASKNCFLLTTIILGVLLVAILFIPLFFILKSKKRTAMQTVASGGCPRCGSAVDLSKNKCPNCGTQF